MGRLLLVVLALFATNVYAGVALVYEDTPLLVRNPEGKVRQIRKLRAGEKVDVVQRTRDGKWAGVRIDGQKGWIDAGTLSPEREGQTDPGERLSELDFRPPPPRPWHMDLELTWASEEQIGFGLGIFTDPWTSDWMHLELGADILVYPLSDPLPVTFTLHARYYFRGEPFELGLGPWLGYSGFMKGADYGISGGAIYGGSLRLNVPELLGLYTESRVGVREGVSVSVFLGMRLDY